MRRLLAIALGAAGAAAVAVLLLGSSAQGSASSRVDIIFDDARGLVGGQQLKIAGAHAGLIDNVIVTPEFKARIEASVESRFMPFHRNATCTIRPEGLIAENYVDCDPGSADAPVLEAHGGHPPTVPITNTTEPVSLLDLFNIFNLPTRQRFMVILDELGIGTAARGSDLNAILRRANPALALARRAIAILERQRAQLATIVDATGAIAAQGASHTANVQEFLDRAAQLSTLTAAHRDPLSLAINRLPALLAAAQPALGQLDVVARDGTPLLRQLGVAAPYLNRVSGDLGPLVKVAKPGLAAMTKALEQAIPAIVEATPLTRQLRGYTHRSLPATSLFARLSQNLQRHGFIENFLGVTYYIAASLSRFDATSHMLSSLLVGAMNGACGNYATTPLAGCEAHYGKQAPYKPVHPKAARAATARIRALPTCAAVQSGCAQGAAGRQPGGPAAQPAPAGSLGGIVSAAQQQAASPAQQSAQALKNLVGYLLR